MEGSHFAVDFFLRDYIFPKRFVRLADGVVGRLVESLVDVDAQLIILGILVHRIIPVKRTE